MFYILHIFTQNHGSIYAFKSCIRNIYITLSLFRIATTLKIATKTLHIFKNQAYPQYPNSHLTPDLHFLLHLPQWSALKPT